jgi:iron complex outermembrane receptor protein
LEHRFNDVFKARHKVNYSNIKMDYRYTVLSGIQTDPVTGVISLNRSIQHTRDTAASLTVDNHLQADFVSGPLHQTLLFGLDYSRLDFDSYWGGDYTAGRVDIFNPHYSNRPPNPALSPDQDGVQHQTGFYMQDQIKWQRWVLSLGGRYDWAKSTVNNSNNGTTARQKDDAFTGRVGLVYLFENGMAPYAGYSTSFEPTAGADAAGAAFEPTTARQFEVGVRYQPTGTNLLLGISAYRLTQENVLTQDPNPPASNPWAQVQTGKVQVNGVELEGKAQLASGLDLIASYTRQDSKIARTNYAAQAGNRFQLTPVHQGALWVNYALPGEMLRGMSIGGGLRRVGDRYGDLNNLIKLPAYTLFDAALSYDFGKNDASLDGLILRLNATNLENKRHITSCPSLTSANCYYGEGRSIKVSLRYEW